MKFLIPFMVAFVLSKLTLGLFDFSYSIFSDGFDAVKLLIDVGAFALFYCMGLYLHQVYLNKKANKRAESS